MSNTAIAKGSAATVREGFGETSIERRGETASTALQARATAEVQARYLMAMQRPRDPDIVRAKLLRACERPGFAERAFYSLPRGDKPGRLTGTPNRIEGLTVRFVEEAIRVSGNILQSTSTIYDDDFKRMVHVAATDLETNAGYERDIVVDKTVERSKPKDRAVILGQRTNSAGNVVYIVQATDDELLQKEGALVSRTLRTLAKRLVPEDVVEECEQRIVATWRNEDARDPDAARKRLCDAFFALGVSPDALREYLGHELEQLTPQERIAIGGLYNAIKEGEVTWAEAFAEKVGAKEEPSGEKTVDAKPAAKTVADRIVERQAAKKAAKTPPGQQTMPATRPDVAESDSPPPDDVRTVGDTRQREPGED